MNLPYFLVLFLFLIGGAPLAVAADCNAIVVDDAHVISDVGKVEAAARQVTNLGAVIRIRTIPTLPAGKSVSSTLVDQRVSCRAWQDKGGDHWAPNVVIIGVSPPGGLAMNFGVDYEPRLGHGKFREILRDGLEPSIVSFNGGDKTALTGGFVKTLAIIDGVLARPTLGGNTVIHQATDLSGLWHVLLLLVCVFAVLGIAGFVLFRAQAEERRKAAQSAAIAARSRVISGLLAVNDASQIAVLGINAQEKSELAPAYARYKFLAQSGLGALSQFDDASGEDPNRARLDVDSYTINRHRYEDIERDFIAPAKSLARQIEAGMLDEKPSVSQPSPTALETGSSASFTPDDQPSNNPAQSPSSPIWEYEQGRGFRPPPPPAWRQPSYAPPQSYAPPPPQPQSSTGDAFLGGVAGGLAGAAIGETLIESIRENERSRERDHDYRPGYTQSTPPSFDPTPSYRPSKADRDDDGGDVSVSSSSMRNDDGGDYSSGDSDSNNDGGGDF